MDESPEPISALDEVRRRMHDLQLPGRRIRRLQIECAVWPVAVVVAGEDAELDRPDHLRRHDLLGGLIHEYKAA